MAARMGRPPKTDEEKKVRESIYFDPDLAEWLKQEAKKYGSVSNFVNISMRRIKEEERS